MIEQNTFTTDNQSIQFCSLGSGSKGNATLLAFDQSLLLIDCGFSIKETIRRLDLKGISPLQISAILVTHEHSDHIAGVSGFSNKFSIPVWLNKGTSLHKKCISIKSKRLFNSHQAFQLGDFLVMPVAVPHDSREATQFIFSVGDQSVGLLTDVGHITSHIIDTYSLCDALLLEFNYELAMLLEGTYPFALKQRVSGDLGHLSNQQAIDMLSRMDLSKISKIVAMHLSEENNNRALVEEKLSTIISSGPTSFYLANQAEGVGWLSL